MIYLDPKMTLSEYATWLVSDLGYLQYRQPSDWMALVDNSNLDREIRCSALLQWFIRSEQGGSLEDLVRPWSTFIRSSRVVETLTGGLPFRLEENDLLFEITLECTLDRTVFLGLTATDPLEESIQKMHVFNAAATEDWGMHGGICVWRHADSPAGVSLNHHMRRAVNE